jgi:uncharacterized protein (TIGR02996 family)
VVTRESFLTAICEAPQDDAVRLVFSDWLEENGEPERAEFIRLQIARATLPADAPRNDAAQERESALLAAHLETWKQELPRWVQKEPIEFVRGFVVRVSTTARRFYDKADELFAATPLEGVCLRRIERTLEELTSSPHLPRLRRLDLTRNVLRSDGLNRLASVSTPCQLTELILDENYVTGNEVRALLQSENLARLERLSLRRSLIWDAGMRTLADTPGLARLRSLNLSDNRLTDTGLAALATSPHLANLTELDLGYTQISTAGLAALAGTPLLARLTNLDLGSNFRNIPQAAETIAVLDHHLAELDLSYTHPTEEGILALANSPASVHLRVLNLYCCGVKAPGIAALVNSPYLKGLARLDLGNNFPGEEATALLRECFGTRVNV